MLCTVLCLAVILFAIDSCETILFNCLCPPAFILIVLLVLTVRIGEEYHASLQVYCL